jgi:hypothetical protein
LLRYVGLKPSLYYLIKDHKDEVSATTDSDEEPIEDKALERKVNKM